MTEQNTLKQTQSMTAAGLNLIAQALSIYDSDLKLAVCNAPFQSMFGLPKHLVTVGARFDDTIRELIMQGEYGEVDDIDAFVAARVNQARAFEAHYMERTRANGQTISVEGSPLPDGGWITVYTDITSAKRSEQILRTRSAELSEQVISYTEELRATNRALASTVTTLEQTKRDLTEAEARIRLTTEMMPAHIAHVNADGIYTFTNQRLSSILPDRMDGVEGLHIKAALGDSAFARIENSLRQSFEGTPAVVEFTDEHSSRRIRTAFTPDGKDGAYILSMDITAETQARVALQQTQRRTLAAQFTSGLAHDFSNLLTIVLGMQGKLQRMDLPPDALDLIAGTTAAAQRGGTLLGRIADMTGQPSLHPEATDIFALLAEVKTLAAATLPEGLTLHMISEIESQHLLLDGAMLQNALLNLVLNAKDACGLNGTITLTTANISDTWLEIIVTDTGTGFSQKALEHATDPFFTTKGNDGLGMGLSMVYDTIKLAGGEVRWGNTDTGACVTLRLPWRPISQVDGGLALLVEDNAALRATIRTMLTDLGHSVIEATSVDEALALIANLPEITITLSDIKLEGDATGLDLAKRLGSDTPPILLMTSLPQSDPLHRDALALAPVLQKPFTAAALKSALNPKTAQ